jgi:hypothetical protein
MKILILISLFIVIPNCLLRAQDYIGLTHGQVENKLKGLRFEEHHDSNEIPIIIAYILNGNGQAKYFFRKDNGICYYCVILVKNAGKDSLMTLFGAPSYQINPTNNGWSRQTNIGIEYIKEETKGTDIYQFTCSVRQN